MIKRFRVCLALAHWILVIWWGWGWGWPWGPGGNVDHGVVSAMGTVA